MSGLRFLPVFVVLVICYQVTLVSSQDDPLATLKDILEKAVNEDVIPIDKAKRLLRVCRMRELTKQNPAEILEEALEIGWRNIAISRVNAEKVKMWASKVYPNTFKPLTILSTSEVVGVFKTNIPDVESQLGQLSVKKLKTVEVSATVLNKAVEEDGLALENAAKVIEEIIKSALNENENAMTTLNKAIGDSVSHKFISESLAWFIIRAAINEDIDKEDN